MTHEGRVSAGTEPLGGASRAAGHSRKRLVVPHAEKGGAKSAGARWDPVARSWYAPGGLTTELARWAVRPPALRGYAADSGVGRWTVEAAIDNAVPLPVITAALYARFGSRQDDSPAMKVIAALRNQFGGHAVTAAAAMVEKGADAPGADVTLPAIG